MEREEAIGMFVALTEAPRQVAEHVLEAHAWDLDQSVDFFLESGGVGMRELGGGDGGPTPMSEGEGAAVAGAGPRSRPIVDLSEEEEEDEDEEAERARALRARGARGAAARAAPTSAPRVTRTAARVTRSAASSRGASAAGTDGEAEGTTGGRHATRLGSAREATTRASSRPSGVAARTSTRAAARAASTIETSDEEGTGWLRSSDGSSERHSASDGSGLDASVPQQPGRQRARRRAAARAARRPTVVETSDDDDDDGGPSEEMRGLGSGEAGPEVSEGEGSGWGAGGFDEAAWSAAAAAAGMGGARVAPALPGRRSGRRGVPVPLGRLGSAASARGTAAAAAAAASLGLTPGELPADVDLEEQRMLLAAATGGSYEPPSRAGGTGDGFGAAAGRRPLSPGAEYRAALRDEQNEAFEASLAEDRRKRAERDEAERREGEEVARREREEREEAAARERRAAEAEAAVATKRAALPEEPAPGAPGTVAVLIRLPDGSRLSRRFAPDAPVDALFGLVDVSAADRAPGAAAADPAPGSYALGAQFPRRTFSAATDGSKTLKEAGLDARQEALFVERL